MNSEEMNHVNPFEISDNNDVSIPSQRYPFANDPADSVFCADDFLQSYGEFNMDNFGESEPFIDASGAINAAIGVTGTVLGFLGVPFAGALTTFYQKLFGFLFPNNNTKQWEEFMKQVEALIDEKISDAVRNKAISELQGLVNNITLYTEALEEWLENKENPAVRDRVLQRWRILDGFFEQQMPSFAVKGFEVLLLVVYTQAANLHLLSLRDAYIYGAEWGLTPTNIDQNHTRLLRHSAEYTDHCVNWYNTGLKQLENSDAKSWFQYNRFRREMTLSVLDVIALFPAYDVKMYPIPTNFQLTREVYTDVIGKIGRNDSDHWYSANAPSFSNLESTLIRTPHVVDYIKKLKIFYATVDYYGIYGRSGKWVGHIITSATSANTTETRNYGTIVNHDSVELNFEGKNIYKTGSLPQGVPPYQIGYVTPIYFITRAVNFFTVSGSKTSVEKYYSKKDRYYSEGLPEEQGVFSTEQLPPNSIAEPEHIAYSHRLCHVTFISVSNGNKYSKDLPLFSWTHSSVDFDNYVYPTKITQLPATKGYNVSIVKEPGFIGGDIGKNNGQILGKYKVNVEDVSQKYRFRVRYATETEGELGIKIDGRTVNLYQYKKTKAPGDPLTYKAFDYLSFSTPVKFNNASSTIELFLQNKTSGTFYLAGIEIIPVKSNYEEELTLEEAKKAVSSLFTDARNALKTDVTDYQIDQAANLVECISGDLYAKEKIVLLRAVKFAKQLSQSQNLLSDPEFNNVNRENSWTASTSVAIIEGDPLYKGRAVQLSSARDENFPTYLYQKIDESTLKPYTRYQLRGFVEGSENLDVYLIRYGAAHVRMNVPYNLEIIDTSSPVNPCEEVDGLSHRSCNVFDRCKQSISVAPDANTGPDQIDGDPHAFSFHIDTGTVDSTENLGIWVAFKISELDGSAIFGNLELIEVGPLSGEALAQVQRKEEKWKQVLAKKRETTAKLYAAAKQAIDQLFADSQNTKLRFDTEFSNILSAEHLVYKIQDIYNNELSAIPGLNYDLFMELENRIQNAITLYDARNILQNGGFKSDVTSWETTANAEVQQIDGASVLVLSNWNASVAQSVNVQNDHGYVLRVTAKKEGIGNGYVTILDCANHIDTLTFSACDSDSDTSSNELTAYVTKTLEIFPDTEQIRIEIGETEGMFYVESVELIRMEN
ncbi:pesticidial crystal protein cry4BA (plasmid) [Bacillus thuringiensis serovar finitimus YBT-020]|uniref:Crystaline entomocidal protoxin n=2 Tax=Bacillus thuringiensis TaxID=1428 RepID=Q306M6_BACTF|nr:crystal protein Cry26Aa [Bacillus thuringiensis serovar finitimus]ADY24756.1 pesticidial crystal protein cry4BA [Bacillus thuringiensis serovar finitimus YBT-020]